MVSMIMAEYNQKPEWLLSAMLSLISQTEQPEELIVVTVKGDENIEMLQAFQEMFKMMLQDDIIKIIQTDKPGLWHQRNIGLKKAKGDYVAFIDSDDYLLPNHVSLLKKVADQYGSSVVYADFLYTDQNLNITGSFRGEEPSIETLRTKCYIPDYALISNKLMQEMGYLREDCGVAAMLDFWLKSMERYPDRFKHIRSPTFLYRQSDKAMSQTTSIKEEELRARQRVVQASYKRCGIQAEVKVNLTELDTGKL